MHHLHTLAQELYNKLYRKAPEGYGWINVASGLTLSEVAFRDFYTDFEPKDVSLATQIGPVTMNVPVLAAAMDTVSGPRMARAMTGVGGAAVIFRHRNPETQLAWIEEAIRARPYLVANPVYVQSDARIEDVEALYDRTHYSTIPVLKGDVLVGMIFTRDISWEGHEKHPVTQWMKPLAELKTVSADTDFETIRNRLLNEKECGVLPVVNGHGRFRGMYFPKDVRHVDPAWHIGKPLVGMAVGVQVGDLERVTGALELGIGVIVIDSSHGNCLPVIEQARRIVSLVEDRAAVIAGNVANIDGYIRLAETGVHAVKAGIGSGSICTTSQVTGAGVPMWSLLRELAFAKTELEKRGQHAPVIIADGGVSGPGFAVRALAAGAHAVMAGEWLAAAEEAGSPEIQNARRETKGVTENRYRGMASEGAIKDRSSDRYGMSKSAPEGVDGWVQSRGSLNRWWNKDAELIRGGFAHLGARNIEELHARGNQPYVWVSFTGAGQQQMAVRVATNP